MTDAYVPLTGPPTWQHAACRGEDPELWFPISGNRLGYNPDGETAVDICRRCPHAPECAAWAVTTDSRDGIWGGLQPEQRDPIVTQKRRRAELERQRRQQRLQRLEAEVPAWRRQQLAHAVGNNSVTRGRNE